MSNHDDDLIEDLMEKHSHDDAVPADIELDAELEESHKDMERENIVNEFMVVHPVQMIHGVLDMWYHQLEKDGALDDVRIDELENLKHNLDHLIESLKDDEVEGDRQAVHNASVRQEALHPSYPERCIIEREVYSFNHESDEADGHGHGCNKKQGEEPPCKVISQVYVDAVERGLEPGDEYTAYVSAPGTGKIVYQITRVAPTGIYGFEISNTVRELRPDEVI